MRPQGNPTAYAHHHYTPPVQEGVRTWQWRTNTPPMQYVPLLLLVHKGMRLDMCRMSGSLEYIDFACSGTLPVLMALSDGLSYWTGLHRSAGKCLQDGLTNAAGPLARLEAGIQSITAICEEMHAMIQRWIHFENPRQRMQLGAILSYRFHEFMALSLLHMNHGETILCKKSHPLFVQEEMERVNHCFAGTLTPQEWTRLNALVLPAINKKEKDLWIQWLKDHQPAA